MVQKSRLRNEWVDAYIAGDYSEIPPEFFDEVKDLASRGNKTVAPLTVGENVSPLTVGSNVAPLTIESKPLKLIKPASDKE